MLPCPEPAFAHMYETNEKGEKVLKRPKDTSDPYALPEIGDSEFVRQFEWAEAMLGKRKREEENGKSTAADHLVQTAPQAEQMQPDPKIRVATDASGHPDRVRNARTPTPQTTTVKPTGYGGYETRKQSMNTGSTTVRTYRNPYRNASRGRGTRTVRFGVTGMVDTDGNLKDGPVMDNNYDRSYEEGWIRRPKSGSDDKSTQSSERKPYSP
jgi:hypothetical protein